MLSFVNYEWILFIIISILHLLENKANSSHTPTMFLGITTLFLSNLLRGSEFPKKTHQFFQLEISCLFFHSDFEIFANSEQQIYLVGWPTWNCNYNGNGLACLPWSDISSWMKFIIFIDCPIKRAVPLPGQPAPYNQLLFQPHLVVSECYFA